MNQFISNNWRCALPIVAGFAVLLTAALFLKTSDSCSSQEKAISAEFYGNYKICPQWRGIISKKFDPAIQLINWAKTNPATVWHDISAANSALANVDRWSVEESITKIKKSATNLDALVNSKSKNEEELEKIAPMAELEFKELQGELNKISAIGKQAAELKLPTGQLEKIPQLVLNLAKARTTWRISYNLLLTTGLLAAIGAVWIIWVSVEDYAYQKAIRNFRLLAMVSFSFAIAFVAYVFPRWLVNDRFLLIPFMDTFGFEIINQRLETNVDQFLSFLDAILLVVVSLLALAVGSTLLEHDKKGLALDQPGNRPSAATAVGAYNEPQYSIDYSNYLTRCFERLRMAIYAGAAVLVVAVYHVSSLYSWPVSLIETKSATTSGIASAVSNRNSTKKVAGIVTPTETLNVTGKPSGNSNPASSSKEGPYTSLGNEMTFGYGVLFSSFLFALFFPPAIILRKRAWALIRAINPEKNTKDQSTELRNRLLSFSLGAKIGQIVAIISPLLAAGLTGWLTNVTEVLK